MFHVTRVSTFSENMHIVVALEQYNVLGVLQTQGLEVKIIKSSFFLCSAVQTFKKLLKSEHKFLSGEN